jgi:prophage antirepressor-like protein
MSTKPSTIIVVTDDNKEYTIRVCGTASDPYFFGKDVCEIMDIRDYKQALRDLVSEDHKSSLKNILEEENNALVPPSWLGVLKTPPS